MTLLDGITSRIIDTERLRVGILERVGDNPAATADQTVILVHGNVSSSLFWQELMQDLPSDLRIIAVDLRGFGNTESAPVDATRGVRDFSDDVFATLQVLGIDTAHLVGWSMGGGVVMQYAIDHPVRSLTLQAPVSPYGFGGTRRDGSRVTADDAGCGAGGANPDFVQRLTDRDMTDEAPTSPRSVFRSGYVAPGYTSAHEDIWVESMNTTSTATGNYPGDSVTSKNWPGFAAGRLGVLNTMAPQYFNTSSIVDITPKPPVLWVRGSADAIVSDASFFDINHLGALGVIPGWPGAESAPAQEMVSQTRDVLDAYRAAGGAVTELVFEGVGHAPHLERPAEFRRALLENIGYIGRRADPAPAHRGDHPQLLGLRQGPPQRRASKKVRSRARASSSRMPPTTSARTGSRRSRSTSYTDPAAPAFSSHAPNTTRPTRACRIAPAHIRHGSRVTVSVHPSRFHDPTDAAACRRATTSAWAVGSAVASRRLRPSPIAAPPASTTTAPTGISPASAARAASARARRITVSSSARTGRLMPSA